MVSEAALSVRLLDRTGVQFGERLAFPAQPRFRQVLALLAFRAGIGPCVELRELQEEILRSS